MCQYIKSIYLKINSLFNKANAKNINLIIVNGLSRKRTNKQRKKEADEERRRKINRNIALAFTPRASVMFFSIKCTFSH